MGRPYYVMRWQIADTRDLHPYCRRATRRRKPCPAASHTPSRQPNSGRGGKWAATLATSRAGTILARLSYWRWTFLVSVGISYPRCRRTTLNKSLALASTKQYHRGWGLGSHISLQSNWGDWASSLELRFSEERKSCQLSMDWKRSRIVGKVEVIGEMGLIEY